MLRNGEGRERALAWIKMHSIGHGSAWCVDEARRPLRIESLAADLGWELQTARNACAQLTHEGRIRTQAGKIFYRADVPEEMAVESNQQDSAENTLYTVFPAYLHGFILSLSAERRAVLVQYAQFRRKLYAEGLAAVRFIDDQMQDNILTQVGCKEKRHLKADRKPSLEWITMELSHRPNFVQGILAGAGWLRTESPETPNTAVDRGVPPSEQTGPSLLVSAPAPAQTKKHSAPSASGFEIIAERHLMDDAAAQKLLLDCRKMNPTVTAREVAILAGRKRQQISGHAKNWVGLLLKAVPGMCSGALLAEARSEAATEISHERRDAETWMSADPRDYDSPELAAYLRAEQAKAVAKLAQLDAESAG